MSEGKKDTLSENTSAVHQEIGIFLLHLLLPALMIGCAAWFNDHQE